MGIGDLNTVCPPPASSTNGFHRRAWEDFSSQSLADSYHEMAQYACKLRKDILAECNPLRPATASVLRWTTGESCRAAKPFGMKTTLRATAMAP